MPNIRPLFLCRKNIVSEAMQKPEMHRTSLEETEGGKEEEEREDEKEREAGGEVNGTCLSLILQVQYYIV